MTGTIIVNKNEIDNRYAWLLALVNSAGYLLSTGSINVYVSGIIILVINLFLMLTDSAKLEASGYKSPLVILGVLFGPIYIIHRAIILRKTEVPYYAIVWFLSLVTLMYITSVDEYNQELEGAACVIVTEILQENNDQRELECKAVKIDEKVNDTFYKAHAIISNGESVKIGIEDKSDDEIFVTMSSTPH
ncbi:hypothetical protein [Dickeya undicola]|uniref:Uncharacterized protein n=1 Tax=Dickeya undicola TaxID=1577887 RepID=A0A3N0FYR7_9GAMM|nr:hypothetical protein [Dickeya undicola]RNM05018.1 hypothetical protein EF878_13590 [Dickeya undicola]